MADGVVPVAPPTRVRRPATELTVLGLRASMTFSPRPTTLALRSVRYPTPIRQLMAAFGHLRGHAARLHLDPSRIVLVGDSAGAQISAQV
ncbi:MAG TPA: alpha/beta hydrolase fold domain-containing protein, partial [Mycobacterium sp.]